MTVPACLEHLPRQGGIPIPWFVQMPSDGSPVDFRVINVRAENMAIRFQLCAVCGRHIAAPPYWFVMGPASIEQLLTFSAPQHRACALAALELCPYLSRRDFVRSERPHQHVRGRLVERDELPPKPSRIALMRLERYGTAHNPHYKGRGEAPLYVTFREVLPSSIEWWSYGPSGRLLPESASVEQSRSESA